MALRKKGEITLIVLTIVMFVAAIVTPIIAVVFLKDSTEKQVVLGDYVLRYKKVNGEETYTIMEYRGDDTEIVIPEKMDGITVVGVGANAFSASVSNINQNIVSITLPDSVNSIGKGAFKGLKNLQTLRIPKNVTVLETDVLSGCTSLQNVTLPANITFKENCLQDAVSLQNVTIIGSTSATTLEKGMVETLLQMLPVSRLQTLFVGKDIIRIDENAFASLSVDSFTIENIVLQDVRYIESGAFKNVQISTFQMSDCIESIGLSAFYGTSIDTLKFYTTSQNAGSLNFNALTSATVNTIEIFASENNDGVFRLNIGGLMTEVQSVYVDDSVKKVEASAFGLNNVEQIEEFNYNPMTTDVEFTSHAHINVLHIRGEQTLTTLPVVQGVNEIYIASTYTGIDISCIQNNYSCIVLPITISVVEGEMQEDIVIENLELYAPSQQMLSSGYIASVAPILKQANVLIFGENILGLTDASNDLTDASNDVATFETLFTSTDSTVKLHTVIFGEQFATLGANAFGKKVADEMAFVGMENLTSVVFNNAFASVGDAAFAGCVNAKFYYQEIDNLTELTIPGLTTVGAYAFAQCEGLNDMHINLAQNSGVVMNEGAFYSVDLATLTINTFTMLDDLDVKTSTGFDLFVESSIKTDFDVKNIAGFLAGLTNNSVTITLNSGVRKVVDTGESNALKNKGIHVVLPNSVEEIGSSVFAGFSGTLVYDFANAVSIGSGAFSGCSALEIVCFSSKLQEVGQGAFTEGGQRVLCENATQKSILSQSGLITIYVKATEVKQEWETYTWQAITGTNAFETSDNANVIRVGADQDYVYYVNNPF